MQPRKPEVSQQIAHTVIGSTWVCSQYVLFYHELLTSHLVTRTFMKQPKQRSLDLEETRAYTSSWCFPSAQVWARKTGFPIALISHRPMRPQQLIVSERNNPISSSPTQDNWTRAIGPATGYILEWPLALPMDILTKSGAAGTVSKFPRWCVTSQNPNLGTTV